MLDKIKDIFSKEKEGNKKVVFILIAAVVVIVYSLINNFAAKNKQDTKIEKPQTAFSSNIINEEVDKVASEKKNQAVESELKKSDIVIQRKKEEELQPQQPTQPTLHTPTSIINYNTTTDNNNEEIKKLKQQIDILVQQQQKQQQQEITKYALLSWASSTISKPIDYGSQQQQDIKQQPIQPQPQQQQSDNNNTDSLYVSEGVLLDDIRLPVGQSKIARIQTDRYIVVLKATATQTGIVFDNNGTIFTNGKRENAYIQVEDKEDGSTNLLSYVISKKGERVSKMAFLSFVKGAAEGLVRNTVSVSALGTTTNTVEGGLRTAISKGVSGGADAFIKEERQNITPDIFVLLKGERVKVMVIKQQ